MISKITEYTVYESPDGGETVYARKSGEVGRQLYSVSDTAKEKIARLKENQLWYNIRQAAKTNPILQQALDQCIMIYKLSKDYEDV